MSRTAKLFFGASVLVGTASIYGVHFLQVQERETMYAGVIRDTARLEAKRVQRLREAEFEEQQRKQKFLESLQTGKVASGKDEVEGISVEGTDWGCKDFCEKPPPVIPEGVRRV